MSDRGPLTEQPEYEDRPWVTCVCGEINTRHCPIHGTNEPSSVRRGTNNATEPNSQVGTPSELGAPPA